MSFMGVFCMIIQCIYLVMSFYSWMNISRWRLIFFFCTRLQALCCQYKKKWRDSFETLTHAFIFTLKIYWLSWPVIMQYIWTLFGFFSVNKLHLVANIQSIQQPWWKFCQNFKLSRLFFKTNQSYIHINIAVKPKYQNISKLT